jgi:hypothetical protein
MKRFAAHYIFLPVNRLYKLHRIELSENRQLEALVPLEQETASTVFLNGVILAVNENTFRSAAELHLIMENCLLQYPGITLFELFERLILKEIKAESPVNLYHLDGIDLLTAKFRTDNSCRDCYIQRIY